jgi:hypothetical protein
MAVEDAADELVQRRIVGRELLGRIHLDATGA